MSERKPARKGVGEAFLGAPDAFEHGQTGRQTARDGAGQQAARAVVAAWRRDAGRKPHAVAFVGNSFEFLQADVRVLPQPTPSPSEPHAESAEFAKPEPHAESAELEPHAETAEDAEKGNAK